MWVSETEWSLVDGITSHVFSGITKPYAYAVIAYARYVDGAWRYASDDLLIQDDLDNLFCGIH